MSIIGLHLGRRARQTGGSRRGSLLRMLSFFLLHCGSADTGSASSDGTHPDRMLHRIPRFIPHRFSFSRIENLIGHTYVVDKP